MSTPDRDRQKIEAFGDAVNTHMAHMGMSENVVYPIVPNGFSDHYPVFKWLAIIGNMKTQHFQVHAHISRINIFVHGHFSFSPKGFDWQRIIPIP